jgi:hypothetical protein
MFLGEDRDRFHSISSKVGLPTWQSTPKITETSITGSEASDNPAQNPDVIDETNAKYAFSKKS